MFCFSLQNPLQSRLYANEAEQHANWQKLEKLNSIFLHSLAEPQIQIAIKYGILESRSRMLGSKIMDLFDVTRLDLESGNSSSIECKTGKDIAQIKQILQLLSSSIGQICVQRNVGGIILSPSLQVQGGLTPEGGAKFILAFSPNPAK